MDIESINFIQNPSNLCNLFDNQPVTLVLTLNHGHDGHEKVLKPAETLKWKCNFLPMFDDALVNLQCQIITYNPLCMSICFGTNRLARKHSSKEAFSTQKVMYGTCALHESVERTREQLSSIFSSVSEHSTHTGGGIQAQIFER